MPISYSKIRSLHAFKFIHSCSHPADYTLKAFTSSLEKETPGNLCRFTQVTTSMSLASSACFYTVYLKHSSHGETPRESVPGREKCRMLKKCGNVYCPTYEPTRQHCGTLFFQPHNLTYCFHSEEMKSRVFTKRGGKRDSIIFYHADSAHHVKTTPLRKKIENMIGQ